MRDDPFSEAVAALTRALAALGAPHAVIGGVAVIAWGVARATADVDASVSAGAVGLERVAQELGAHGFVPRIGDALEFARRSQVLLLRHAPSGIPADIALAWLPFEEEMLAATVERDFAGFRIRVPTPTDLVILKLVAHRPRDLDDIEFLVRAHPIEFERVRKVVRQFCEVLEDDSRLATVSRMERVHRQALPNDSR